MEFMVATAIVMVIKRAPKRWLQHRPGRLTTTQPTRGNAMASRIVRTFTPVPQDQEEWRPVAGLAGRYEVSSHGRVRSLPFSTIRSNGWHYTHRGGILNPAHRMEHEYVQLYYEPKKQTKCWVHRLVLESFVGPAPTDKHEVNHIDGNPRNNHVSNLEWVTRAENIAHAVANKLHARGTDFSHSVLTPQIIHEARELHSNGMSWRAIGAQYGVGKEAIRQAVIGGSWKHLNDPASCHADTLAEFANK